MVLRPLPRGQAVRRQLPLPGRAGPTTGRPPKLDADVEVPGEQVLVDADELAEGHDFFSLGSVSVSPDGHLLAFSTDTVGNERYLLRVKDLRTGELLPDEVPEHPGRRHLGPSGHHAVLLHRRRRLAPRQGVAARASAPRSPTTWSCTTRPTSGSGPAVGRTRSDRFLVRASGSQAPPRSTPSSTPTTRPASSGWWHPRREGVEYSVEHAVLGGEDRLLVLHNDGAENYALASRPVDATSHEQWGPLLPHDPAVRLEDVDAFAEPPGGQPAQRGPHPAAGDPARRRAPTRPGRGLPGRVRRGGAHRRRGRQPGVRPADGPARLHDAGRPAAVYDFDVAHPRAAPCCKRTPVLPRPTARVRPGRATRSPASGRPPPDGTRVPISIVVPADAPRDGSMPMVLYGYGSYEDSMDPWFSIARLSLLDRGIGFAIAHVRGGGEMGRHVVRRRQAAAQDEHLHRLRGLRPAPRRRPAGPRRTGSPPRAAAPAAC